MPLDRATSDDVITDALIPLSQEKWSSAAAGNDVKGATYWMARHMALLKLRDQSAERR